MDKTETKPKKRLGFLMACKQYFGYHTGQTLSSFANEMKQVDFPFRVEIYKYLKSIGIECDAPAMK